MANILEDVQNYVVGKLSGDCILSACHFLAENRKDIDYEIKNVLGRQGIVGVVMTPKAVYAGKYEDLFLAWQLDELEIDIVENVTVNRGKRNGFVTGQDAAMRLFDVLCPLSGDYEGQLNPVSYEEGEDSGLIVNRCILKALIYGEHGDTPQPEPGLNMQFVKLLDGPPSKPPHDGWMWPVGDGFVLWQNGTEHFLGDLTFNAMSAYVEQQLSNYLPAELYGLHDEYATVRKVVEITDPRSQSINEPVLALAQNGAERSLEIIDTNSLAAFNFGVLSSGVPKISFGIDDPTSFNTAYFPNKSGTLAYTSDLSDYLPIWGGTMYGTIGFSPEADQELGYKLLQLNPTGEYWQALFGVDDSQGQPYVAHNGSETGTGEWYQYSWKLFFPDENGTLATKEWTSTQLSDFALTSQLPTKTSELSNDSGFITSAQVEPSTDVGMNGYAANSDYATKLKALDMSTGAYTDRGTIVPTLNYDSATNTYTLDLYGSVGGYYPWILRRLFGTDFSPVITLEWRKGTIWRKRVIGSTVRWSIVYNNNWMWLAKGQYAITCPTGDGKPDGNFYVLNYEDETHPNYINDPATDVHTITYSNNNITSIDGQAGGQESQTIWCTRTNANPTVIWERPFAYRNELSAKADVSALNAVESTLSNYLPLSGGTLQGSIEIPSPYDLSVGMWHFQDKDLNGLQIGDGYDFWKFSGSTEQPQDVMRRMDISAFPTTDEISATRVETMTTIHESDWAGISASASSSTLYIVIPD